MPQKLKHSVIFSIFYSRRTIVAKAGKQFPDIRGN